MTDDRDRANAPAEAAAPGFLAWARGHGWNTFEWWSLNNPTQLLRHGFMQETRAIAFGAIPGVEGQVQFALTDFAEQGSSGLDAHWFTVALMAIPGSLAVASRVLCHDRGLDDASRSNPDRERQLIELDDQAVRLESESFLARYTLSADHDQDNVRTWEILDPSLVEWLTTGAPEGFSFELQDGALCCFVPGTLDEPAKLDELVAASGRVAKRVTEVAAGAGSAAPLPAASGSRRDLVEQQLAEHRFTEPPDSVRDAAKSFRHGLLIEDQAWKLGEEAFFRAFAATIGMRPMDIHEFMAANQNATVPGVLTQIAHGPLPGSDVDGYFALSSGDTESEYGFLTLFAPALPGVNNYSFATDAEASAMDDYDWSGDASRVYVWRATREPRKRKRSDLEEFVKRTAPVLARLVSAPVAPPLHSESIIRLTPISLSMSSKYSSSRRT